jgi:predicted RNA methylase
LGPTCRGGIAALATITIVVSAAPQDQPSDSAALEQYQAQVDPVANLLTEAGKQDVDFGAIAYDFPHRALDVYRKSGTPDARCTQIADQYGVTIIFHKSLMTPRNLRHHRRPRRRRTPVRSRRYHRHRRAH